MKKLITSIFIVLTTLVASSQNTMSTKSICKSNFFRQILSDTSYNSPFLKLTLKYSNLESAVFVRSKHLYMFLKQSNGFSYEGYIDSVQEHLINDKPLVVQIPFVDNKEMAIIKDGIFDSLGKNCLDEQYLQENFIFQGILDEEKAGEKSIAITCCFFDLGYIINEGDFTPGISVKKFKCN